MDKQRNLRGAALDFDSYIHNAMDHWNCYFKPHTKHPKPNKKDMVRAFAFVESDCMPVWVALQQIYDRWEAQLHRESWPKGCYPDGYPIHGRAKQLKWVKAAQQRMAERQKKFVTVPPRGGFGGR